MDEFPIDENPYKRTPACEITLNNLNKVLNAVKEFSLITNDNYDETILFNLNF